MERVSGIPSEGSQERENTKHFRPETQITLSDTITEVEKLPNLVFASHYHWCKLSIKVSD